MKLLLDQGTPLRTAARLRSAGWDVVHTHEIGLAAASDEVILLRAKTEGRVVVTLDADFHQLLANTNAQQPSVVRVRIEGLNHEAMTGLLQRELTIREPLLESGVAISITERGVRLRKLPLPKSTEH